jgi:hypothetical protein
LTWLAPAAAAFALLCAVFFHQPNSATPSGSSSVSPIMAIILSNQSAGSVLLEASNREPAAPATYRRTFDLNSNRPLPKAFGVATSAVSTGSSERLPEGSSRLQRPAEGPSDYPTTNGSRIAPQAGVSVPATWPPFRSILAANRHACAPGQQSYALPHDWANLDTATGARAVLGSQQPPMRLDTHADFAPILPSNMLRTEDGSRSVRFARFHSLGLATQCAPA